MLCPRVTLGSLCRVCAGMYAPCVLRLIEYDDITAEIAGSGFGRFLGCDCRTKEARLGLIATRGKNGTLEDTELLAVSSNLACPALFETAALPSPSKTRIASLLQSQASYMSIPEANTD